MDEVGLEQLTPGTRVWGVLPDRAVTTVQVEWHGRSAVTLTYRTDSGGAGEQLLYRDDEAKLRIEAGSRAWAFDASGDLFRLVSEARRIQLAYLFDPFLAVNTSNIDPLPHQIEAVYGHMLPRQPLRFLLADDPGAGKTIMAGLYMKELLVRGDLQRGLIIAPGSLVEQWQDELFYKFGLEFDILTREMIEASRTGNPFEDHDKLIIRLDQVARNEELQAKLEATDWDLVVVDEAHKMSAHYFGSELKRSLRYKLGMLVGGLCRHFLLMTATPHSGKEEDFQLFLALLDSDRFEGKFRDGVHTVDVQDVMRRLVKERLLKFDGKPLFPERRAYSVNYHLSDPEVQLYDDVTEYVREEMNRAERLQQDGKRRAVVGFALTTMQRRLASSPEAIYKSLHRRRGRLEDRLREAELDERAARLRELTELPKGYDLHDLEDTDELLESEVEDLEEQLVDQASAAQTVEELRLEIQTLKRLEKQADELRKSGVDTKWQELSGLLQDQPEMFDEHGNRRKIIIFTEHRDTLSYLEGKITTLLGRPDSIRTIHGGTRREERRAIQQEFTQDKDVHVLLATDAAGEGINLQRAHLMVNYDLPWNPNRIEQRFGRIHRIGQTEVCHLWNLVAIETREGDVFRRLFEKLETQRGALGDQVFDVLGEVFTSAQLRELLIEAIRYGNRSDIRAKLDQVVDATVGDNLRALIEERALASDVMGPADVERIREEMERAEARKLQPHFVQAYFEAAFRQLGGQMRKREEGRFEITRVPADVRARDRQLGAGAPVLRKYERVTFDRCYVTVHGRPRAELLAPGHPLMESVTDLILERYSPLLKKGAILVDDDDAGEEPRVLLYLEHTIQDARPDGAGEGRRVVSKRFEFVSLDAEENATPGGFAPFLDLRPATEEEAHTVQVCLADDWLAEDIGKRGESYAIEHLVPAHLAEVRRRTLERVDRIMKAVHERLTKEIQHWDHRAQQLKQREEAGKQTRTNWQQAEKRADELQTRLKQRLEELEQEKQLAPKPPVVVGGAFIVPRGLLERLAGEREAEPSAYAKEVEEVDRRAVDAVLAAEQRLGRQPREMPHNNPGYDVESKDPERGPLYFIEVKGRIEGGGAILVKKTQVMMALNSLDKDWTWTLAVVEVPEDRTAEPTVRYVDAKYLEDFEASAFKLDHVPLDWDAAIAASKDPQ